MKPSATPLSRDRWIKLVLGAILLFSLLVRLFPALLAGFPLNDGGMILTMIRDLRLSGFMLPDFTSYNGAKIPFAYPPFGFYVGAILSALGVPELEILRWLPIAVNFVSIPAFYLLAKALLKDDLQAVAATLVYALVPGSFAWQIMGGGMTRSFGLLFFILANYCVYMMFQIGRRKFIWLAVLFCSLAVLSHPEAGLATAASCALLWIFSGRSRSITLRALLVGLGTILLTAPWWGSVIASHGLAPFQAVMHSGAYTANPLKVALTGLFTFDLWFGLFHLLFLAGVFWSLYRRRFFLPLWIALPYLVEPRSAAAVAYIPESLLAGYVLVEGLLAIRDWHYKRRGPTAGLLEFTQLKEANAVVFGLLLVWFLQSSLYGFPLANTSLRPPEPQQAMSWAKESTPVGSEFLILTGNLGIMTDPMQEWFPALAERNSRTTLQGMEWTLGAAFFPRLEQLAELQSCQNVGCVESWSARTGLDYSHLLVEKNGVTQPLLDSLLVEEHYRLIYENDDYLIFERANEQPRNLIRGCFSKLDLIGPGSLLHHAKHSREPIPQDVCSWLTMDGG